MYDSKRIFLESPSSFLTNSKFNLWINSLCRVVTVVPIAGPLVVSVGRSGTGKVVVSPMDVHKAVHGKRSAGFPAIPRFPLGAVS